MKIVKYIILYNIMWGISISMCYLHRFIDDINYSFQDFLITFFELLAWIVLIIGAINTCPKDKYSNKRVWFYYAIMRGFISAIHSFIGLISILKYNRQDFFLCFPHPNKYAIYNMTWRYFYLLIFQPNKKIRINRTAPFN